MTYDNTFIKYFKGLFINWRCVQKKPIGGTLILVKDDLEEDFINALENFLFDFKVDEDEFNWNGATIKLI